MGILELIQIILSACVGLAIPGAIIIYLISLHRKVKTLEDRIAQLERR